ncbi:MAG: FemAB family PEP-CTERM system-associated protein [Desulfuromonadales bacterium]|nr:MAG: FemAB family PEP-CTERM system-associated protein [Desulfuromonadales bacterium]
MLAVKEYTNDHRHVWDTFVAAASDGSCFHRIGWKDAVESSFGHRSHYLMAMDGDDLRGVLPLFEVRSRLFGHSLVSVPFGVYGGIVAADREAAAALRSSAESLAERIGVDYLELRHWSSCHDGGTGPEEQCASDGSRWHKKDLYVTFVKPILPTVVDNMNAIPRKQRAMVRKGEKTGLISRVGKLEDLERFYAIYARNVRDLGSPVYPLSFFRALMENFSDTFILSIWKDGAMVAGVLTFVHGTTLLPYYGGGLREYFDYAINDFMYWELMRYGCEHGYGHFDFGRSKRDTGSYKFKKHWGFEPTPLDYECYLVRATEMPNISPVNPKYELMINVWKRLPLVVTNWLGPKLVRGIP